MRYMQSCKSISMLNLIQLVGLICIFVFPTFAFAAPDSCVKELYLYGRKFSPAQFGKGATKEFRTEPNENGAPGELLNWTTLRLNSNWVTVLDCKSCSPRKSVTELLLSTKRKLPCGLKNEMSENDITQRLGAPYQIENEHLYYSYPPVENNQLIVLLMDKGKLHAIHWMFYMD